MVVKLELYTGPHCELCDQAKNLIYKTLSPDTYELITIDATKSLATKKAYGLRIPVLRNLNTNEELSWPFDANQLLDFTVIYQPNT